MVQTAAATLTVSTVFFTMICYSTRSFTQQQPQEKYFINTIYMAMFVTMYIQCKCLHIRSSKHGSHVVVTVALCFGFLE